MLSYIIRRIFLFIPTLIAISLLAFIISAIAPGDPVERMVTGVQRGSEVSTGSASFQEQKKLWRRKLGLDLPLFYFSISSLATPDTLYRIYDKYERNALERLIDKYGNWDEIQEYYSSLLFLEKFNRSLNVSGDLDAGYSDDEIQDAVNFVSFETIALQSVYRENVISAKINLLRDTYIKYPFLNQGTRLLKEVEAKYQAIKENPATWKNYIPKLNFYWNNQYHRWIFGDGNWLTGKGYRFTKGVVRGDFGISYITKQPVSEKIGEKIFWSLILVIISVMIAYVISIPVGIKAAVKKDSWFDRISGLVVFILYSMPSFWVAVILLMIFANPSNFSDYISLLPASGVKPATGYPEGAGILEKAWITAPFLILPVICYTYGSFAFLSRTMRVSMLEVVGQDYIRTAKAKGLVESKVIYKHGLRNALLPVITVFANVFPLAIGGSVILESIFTIPGMGNEIFMAIHNKDFPMIVAVFTLTGVFTMIGFLISDILYAVADPRITFVKK